MLSSRRAMSRSMILRAMSNGSPAEHEVLALSVETTIESLNWILFFKLTKEKEKYLEPCDLLNTKEAQASPRTRHFKRKIKMGKVHEALESVDPYKSRDMSQLTLQSHRDRNQ